MKLLISFIALFLLTACSDTKSKSPEFPVFENTYWLNDDAVEKSGYKDGSSCAVLAEKPNGEKVAPIGYVISTNREIALLYFDEKKSQKDRLYFGMVMFDGTIQKYEHAPVHEMITKLHRLGNTSKGHIVALGKNNNILQRMKPLELSDVQKIRSIVKSCPK